jgi:hypothetical protein
MRLNSKSRKTHWVISIWFILLITLPFLGSVFGWDFYPLQNENRKMAAFPDLKATTLDALPNKLEAYYNDHFGFRNTFIRRKQKLERKWFKRNTSRVLKGTSPGWYFYKLGNSISDYLGNEQFSEEELAIWTTTLETRKNYLSERGIPYVLFICPNKTMVYPEYLPDETDVPPSVTPIVRLEFVRSQPWAETGAERRLTTRVAGSQVPVVDSSTNCAV